MLTSNAVLMSTYFASVCSKLSRLNFETYVPPFSYVGLSMPMKIQR